MNNADLFKTTDADLLTVKCILNGGICLNGNCRQCTVPIILSDDARAYTEALQQAKGKTN